MELVYGMTYRALLEPPREVAGGPQILAWPSVRESSARWTQHWSRYSG